MCPTESMEVFQQNSSSVLIINIIDDVCLAEGYFDCRCGIVTKIANGMDPVCRFASFG